MRTLSKAFLAKAFPATAFPGKAFLAKALLIAATGPLIAFTSSTGQAAPRDVVAAYQSGLISIMKQSDSLGFEGRFRALAPIVDRAYHMQTIARRSIGASGWRQMSASQKKKYVAAYRDFSIANHAARFKGYGGQRFEVTGERRLGPGQVLVETRLVGSGNPVTLNYLMVESGGRWGIADVYLRGSISEVATRRSEFASVLRNHGVDGLIDAIERKTAALRS